MNEKLRKRISELTKEKISLVPYNPSWPEMFDKEADFLKEELPQSIIKRVEHFGSTAIPNLSAKPVIDILVEVSHYDEVKKVVVPILEALNYEYFWRPALGDTGPPYYAWFIKRNKSGERTHHIHMVEADSELWERIYFRDYLREFTSEAQRYDTVKWNLAKEFPDDRVKYTEMKSTFITSVTQKALKYYNA